MSEFFWFTGRYGYRAHAFELVSGELAAKSICGDARLDDADDEPQREPIPKAVVMCRICKVLAMPARASA